MNLIPSPGTMPIGGHPTRHFGAARKILFIAALLAASCGPCARAFAVNNTPNKAQISIETKYAKISLTVDSELRPFTELFANCLAEGKAWFNKTNSDTAAEWRDNRSVPWPAMVLRPRLCLAIGH